MSVESLHPCWRACCVCGRLKPVAGLRDGSSRYAGASQSRRRPSVTGGPSSWGTGAEARGTRSPIFAVDGGGGRAGMALPLPCQPVGGDAYRVEKSVLIASLPDAGRSGRRPGRAVPVRRIGTSGCWPGRCARAGRQQRQPCLPVLPGRVERSLSSTLTKPDECQSSILQPFA